MNTEQQLNDQLHWYKDAIIYELHIKAFCDSNGDGIGDFEGLLTKLDYLQELGVTAIWVLPFYPSPLKDDGYDIADYYTIHPNYGNIEQFKRFLDESHKRNLKVITELVINHTSDQHPWFQRARKAPKDSPERNFYVWSDDPNQYKDVRIIFQDFEASNWTWDPVAQQYYWHRFFHHQPDLNYDSPLVQQEVFNVLDYWCSMGVDGFRLDAVPYLFEREGTNGENLPETHEFLKKLRKFVDENHPGTVFLAEANMWPEDSASYFGNGDECHMNYHFPVMPRMFMAVHREDRYPITDIFDQTPEIPDTCQWAMFLRNHDELTLEMVTDEERDYMYRVYAKDPKAKINLGIRHRLAPLMDNDRRKIELMNSLLFSMKGTPVIYYGDEIGMGDNFYLGDRNGVRTPMQWSPDRNAGFSSANPHSLYLPVIIDPLYNYEAVNVETQRLNTSSLFWFMKRIINMRKKYKAFGRGNMNFIHVDNPKVLAFTRTYQEETLLIVVNLSKHPQAAELDLLGFSGYIPIEMFSGNRFPAVKENKPYFFTLSAHSFLWFVMESTTQATETDTALPFIQVNSWQKIMDANKRHELETQILPNFLISTKWFITRGSPLHTITITDHVSIETDVDTVHLCLLELQFESGLPMRYLLPLTKVQPDVAKAIENRHPSAIIAQLQTDQGNSFICDAIYTKWYQGWIFRNLVERNVMTLHQSVLHFATGDAILNIQGDEEFHYRWHADNAAYTSLTLNNQVFLKMYRRVEQGIHPDVETTRFLSLDTSNILTPSFLGTFEWMLEKENFSLGMVQQMVENHGTGESFMQERINNFIERLQASEKPLELLEINAGNLTNPVLFSELNSELQKLVGSTAADFCQQLGRKLAHLHKALANGGTQNQNFGKEPFSLHYQRSLFSGMQSLVRAGFDNLQKHTPRLPEDLHERSIKLQQKRNDLLEQLKRIYTKKLEAQKIRIHGHLTLGQILMTGRGLCFHDFGGRMSADFSERRLKRSPIRDLASLVRSIYIVTYKGFMQNAQLPSTQVSSLLPYARKWACLMSGFFIQSYLEDIEDAQLFPNDPKDLDMMIETFLLRGALIDLNEGFLEKEKAYAAFDLLENYLNA